MASNALSLKATILGVVPTAAQLSAIIALEQQGEDSASKAYLSASIPLLVLPHPKSGIPCASSVSATSVVGAVASGAAPIPIAGPIIAGIGQLTSFFGNLLGGPSGEQKAEAPILCGGYLDVNQAFSQLDSQLQLGEISLEQYLAQLTILQQQFNNLVAPVNQPNSASDRYTRIVDALVKLRQQIAPTIQPIGEIISETPNAESANSGVIVSNGNSFISSLPTSISGLTSGSGILLVVGAIIFAVFFARGSGNR